MADVPNPSFDRRTLLRNSGLVLSFGALVAACGDDRTGSDAPGRLGVAVVAPALPEAEVDDGVLLRTAQSLEYTALAVYEAAAGLDALDATETSLVERFVADHERHASEIGALVSGAGADEFRCPNPFVMERAVAPILAALDGTDDLHRDVMNIAHAFESWAGASYQALVGSLGQPELRSEAIRIGGEEQRHAAALAAAINPTMAVSPVLLGDVEQSDDAGFPVPYAIPATFGQLTGIDLVVGARNEEGSRFSIQLQTPAANSLVYDYLSC